MNNTKLSFTMMVGLPGSGKSTYAKVLAKEADAIICSSDELREELFGDVNSQENNDCVFAELHKRVKDGLRSGRNVIYDATNISSKRRRAFLDELRNISCTKKCMVMATSFFDCQLRNSLRDRKVPLDVLIRMYKSWNTPYWYEGWDEIAIEAISPGDRKKEIQSWLDDHEDYNQDNPHHTMTLGKHCTVVGDLLLDDPLLQCAGYLHDCGKPMTRGYINSKGEKTDIAHYYQHHCVGAYESLFFNYPEGINPLDVSILVNLHMQPYFWEKDKKHGTKTIEKNYRLWGEELFNNILKLHMADKAAH